MSCIFEPWLTVCRQQQLKIYLNHVRNADEQCGQTQLTFKLVNSMAANTYGNKYQA